MAEGIEHQIKRLEFRKAECARDPLEVWIREYVAEEHPWNEPELLQRANEIKIARELAMLTMDRELERLRSGQK
jgi:hypothetical protein